MERLYRKEGGVRTIAAIDKIKQLGKEEVIQRIAALELREYGVYHDRLVDLWEPFLRKNKKPPVKLVVGLNNNDTAHILLNLLKADVDRVIEGMQIAAYLLDAEKLILYLPKKEVELKEKLIEIIDGSGIDLCNDDFIDRRKYDRCVIHHIETMYFLAEAFSDMSEALPNIYTPGVFVSVSEQGKSGELCKIPFGTKVADLISTPALQVKGIEIGSRLYDASALDLIINNSISMGNGVITVIDNSDCIIDETEKRLTALRNISCGKCTFCREGLVQLYTMIKDITMGRGKNEYIPLIKEIGEAMPISTLCSVGHTGSDFAMGGLSNFISEYDDHIKRKRCRLGICSAFIPIYIDPKLCTGCGKCIDVCPEDCIEGKPAYIHLISEFECSKCGKCIEACEEKAIMKAASGKVPKLPVRPVKCGRF